MVPNHHQPWKPERTRTGAPGHGAGRTGGAMPEPPKRVMEGGAVTPSPVLKP